MVLIKFQQIRVIGAPRSRRSGTLRLTLPSRPDGNIPSDLKKSGS
jgi:hypothetical protein